MSLVETIARSVEYAHKQGVLHYDMNPANILFDEQQRPFLADFGVARVADSATITTTGRMVGTLAYMPPEQADGRSDGHSTVEVYASRGASMYGRNADTLAF